jgi:hypothetical protein
MSEALRMAKLSEEAQQFVKGTPPKAPTPASEPPPTNSSPPPDNSPIPSPAQIARPERSSDDAAFTGKASLTFRLPAGLSVQLADTAAERKRRRERPFSQQDIVAEALADWLNRHRGST